MIARTKMYGKFQIAVPAEIRKKLGISKDDNDYMVEWDIDENKEVKLKFRKKSNVMDIVGLGKTKIPTNAVELKKKYQRGEKIDFSRF